MRLPIVHFQSTCVSESEFAEKVVLRLRHALSPSDAVPAFRVSIVGPTLEGQIAGFVDILLSEGQFVRRRVSGADCEAVGDALAIVVVLFLERDDPRKMPKVAPIQARRPSPESTPVWALAGGASGIASNVLNAGTVLGVAGQIQIKFSTVTADPILSIGLYRFDNIPVEYEIPSSPGATGVPSIRKLHLNLSAARFTIWPGTIPVGENFELRPGVLSELGEIAAEEARSPRVWWAGGVALSLNWVSEWFTLSSEVGAILPLETQTFSSRPAATGGGQSAPFHTIKSAGIFGQIGAVLWIL